MKSASILFLLVLALPTVTRAADHAELLVDRVAAVVNDEVITQSEFDMVFRPIYEQMKKAYQGADLDRQIQEVRFKLLNQLIEDRLVYQEAKKLGIEVSDSELQEDIAAFKGQFQDQAAFDREMAQAGVTMSDIEKRFRERIAIAKLHESVIRGKVIVAPAEAEAYYKDHPNEFNARESLKVWSITVRKSDEAIQKGIADEQAKRKAEKILAHLKRGGDFSELAKKHSEDPHAKEGGFMGEIQKGDLVEHLDGALFSIPEGSHSEILETEHGYHLFKTAERKPPAEKTFEQAKDQIYEMLFRKKAHERFVGWMEELKKKAYVSIR